ncbi:dehydrase and lipid transport-domain-containing protein [Irpex rosettiformis]|uniref:Dehydrase and lipid transport-domain-containing protein n=1 Tax=Irpex rosettiformis TaxID=378272 RepID=A0ACB8U4H9_9APHY|nr:dehydrase and lipid transport-domain-containing protein [Irpex rosettiformis]
MFSLLPTAAAHSARHSARSGIQARTFISLPDLSSLSPFSNSSGSNSQGPQTYQERRILPYKQSELYAVVTDVASYPKFLPFCTDVHVFTTSPFVNADGRTGKRLEAEMSVGFMSLSESYTSDVKCIPNLSCEAVASSSTTLFKSLSTVWRFQPASTRSIHATQHAPLPANVTSLGSRMPDSTLGEESTDAAPTLVMLDLAFSFSNPLHATISAAFFGQVSKMMVSAFEERCLELYGPGRR